MKTKTVSIQDLQTKINDLISNEDIKIGHYRFLTRLKMLVPHLIQAGEGLKMKEMDMSLEEHYGSLVKSGLLFYQSNFPDFSGKSRNALFHLEAICRIYREGHDKNIFEGLLTQFKELEDGIGRVDYHDAFRKEAEKIGAPKEVFGYFTGGYHVELQNLTKRLLDSKWLCLDGNVVSSPTLERILKILENVEWKKYKRDRKNIIKSLIRSLEKVLKKGGVTEGESGLDFNELEDGVHEFRRTVRWISIYPSSLGGMCRLSSIDNIDPSVKEFLRFASFKEDGREKKTINLDANSLLSFSKIIDDIGNIKDDGQLEEAMSHAMLRTDVVSEDKLEESVKNLVHANNTKLDEIPQKVKSLVDDFLVERKIPQQLINNLKEQL